MKLIKSIFEEKVSEILLKDVVLLTVKPMDAGETKKLRYKLSLGNIFLTQVKRSLILRHFRNCEFQNAWLGFFEGMSDVFVIPFDDYNHAFFFNANGNSYFQFQLYKRLLLYKLDRVILTPLQVDNMAKYLNGKFFSDKENSLVSIYFFFRHEQLKFISLVFFIFFYKISSAFLNDIDGYIKTS